MNRLPWIVLTLCLCMSLTLQPVAANPMRADDPDTLDWQVQTLEVRGDTGQYVSLAVDAYDYPHLAYVVSEGSKNEVRYARWDGLRWLSEAVVQDTEVGEYLSLALNADGQPHIVYYHRSTSSLNYAQRISGQWDIVPIVTGPAPITHPSLVLDPISGLAHFVYFNNATGRLRHARQRWLASWAYTDVDESSNAGEYASLAYSADGSRLGVSYYDRLNGALKYALWDPAAHTWSVQTVDSEGDAGVATSLAFDELNQPHISYIETESRTLKHAQQQGDTWIMRAVDSPVENASSLVLGENAQPIIAYAQNGARVARLQEDGWQRELVDETVSVHQWISQARDTQGREHLAYYDDQHGDLVYAVWGTAWQRRVVSTDGDSPSLAVRAGQPYIFYRQSNAPNGIVESIGWERNVWQSLAFGVGVGSNNNGLVMGADGERYVAFYQASTRQLIYAANEGEEWGFETVVTFPEEEMVQPPIQLLHVNNEPHILYTVYDGVTIRLRMARRVDSVWQGSPHALIRPLGTGPAFDAVALENGMIALSYYDASAGDLRLALWNGQQWLDTLIDSGDSEDVGSYNAIALRWQINDDETVSRHLAVAYYNRTARSIQYAMQEADGWQSLPLVADAGYITALDLAVTGDDRSLPVVAYFSLNPARLLLASADGGLDTVRVETITEDLGAFPTQVQMIYDNQPRLVYADGNGQIIYTFPTARSVIPAPLHNDNNRYRKVGMVTGTGDIFTCLAFFLVRRFDLHTLTARADGDDPLTDGAVIGSLADIFRRTTAGQRYIDLYTHHALDLAAAVAADPALIWDSYRVMQNFMPGLEGFVKGDGEAFMISEEMTTNALAIWQRLAAAGSPALAAAINEELTRTENLAIFAGESFDHWAAQIGVSAATNQIYLPHLNK
jgi:hypothetical protein